MNPAATHLLVVDDNEVNRDMLALHLEMRGFKSTLAASGREALSLLQLPHMPGLARSEEREFDLVLLDVMMPQISGIEVLNEIRLRYSRAELPVLMVTAKDASEDVVEALQQGANDYITKPIDFPVLFARLEAALQVQRLTREKDEFMAIASHDLKNPLAVVRGFVKMIHATTPEGTPLSTDARDMLQRVFRQTTSMERIISDFLDFNAIQDGHLVLQREPIDLCAIAHSVLQNMEVYAKEKGIAIHESECSALTVLGDEARLEQVLQNYIGNAIKFGVAGSDVRISVSHRDTRVRVEVRDSGPGIPEHEADRLFVKYSRLSTRPTAGEKSSGLGLVICKQIVELHGGQVGARNNTPDKGATFWFELPAGDASSKL
ncbi:MAG: hybrid sensor histidine kinase/response regulator [Candidatus Sumerlaeaceae bacterium]